MNEADFKPLIGKTIAGYRWVDEGDEYSDGPWIGQGIILVFTDGTTMGFHEQGQVGQIDYRWE